MTKRCSNAGKVESSEAIKSITANSAALPALLAPLELFVEMFLVRSRNSTLTERLGTLTSAISVTYNASRRTHDAL